MLFFEEETKLIMHSDSCVEQNKNFTLTGLWLWTIDSVSFEDIENNFVLLGYTLLLHDDDFGVTGKVKRKTQVVYTPGQWSELKKEAEWNILSL